MERPLDFLAHNIVDREGCWTISGYQQMSDLLPEDALDNFQDFLGNKGDSVSKQDECRDAWLSLVVTCARLKGTPDVFCLSDEGFDSC